MKVLSENFEIQAANGIFLKWITPEAYNSFPFLFPFWRKDCFSYLMHFLVMLIKSAHQEKPHSKKSKHFCDSVSAAAIVLVWWGSQMHTHVHVHTGTQGSNITSHAVAASRYNQRKLMWLFCRMWDCAIYWPNREMHACWRTLTRLLSSPEEIRSFASTEKSFTVKMFTFQFFTYFTSLFYAAFILGR